jgi:hypothetical protein
MNRTDGTRMAALHLQLHREVCGMTPQPRRWVRLKVFARFIAPGLAAAALVSTLIVMVMQ